MHLQYYFLRSRWLLLITFCVLSASANAQNLNGEKIKVSSESITVMKFNAKVDAFECSVPADYSIQLRKKDNALTIRTLPNEKPAPANLVVSEGGRTHYFIFSFLEKVNINEDKLYYDYSDLKLLKKIAQNTNAAVVTNDAKEKAERVEKEELSAKEKKKLEKENEAKRQLAAEKQRQEEAESQRLLAEQERQAEKLKQQERAEQEKKQQAAQEQQRLADDKKKKEDADRERKEQERIDAIAKEQERIKADQEKQKQLATAKEAERKQKASEEAARIKKLNDDKAAAAAVAKEKQRLEAERQKQIAEEKERIRQEQEQQKQLAALKEKQRKEEEQQKKLAKIEEEKRKKEEAERLKKEAEANKTSYTHTELWKKYPNIVFGDPPTNQHLTGEYYLTADTIENSRVSYRLLAMDHWLNTSSQTVNGVSMVMQSMIFSGVNCYIRILIKNDTDKDFLAGRMNLKWTKTEGGDIDLFPGFVTEFPVVLPHKGKIIVYVSRAVNAGNKDQFTFTMMDRLEKTNLELSFTGTSYNTEMSK